jgi:hypothetical protein
MNVCDIRPLSTYIGVGGVSKKIKAISMKVDGSLTVEWRRVPGNRNNRNIPLRGSESIEQFAQWAKLLIDTWSDDLEHYLFESEMLDEEQAIGNAITSIRSASIVVGG